MARSRRESKAEAQMRDLSFEIASRVFAMSGGDVVQAAERMAQIDALIEDKEFNTPEDLFAALRDALESLEVAQEEVPRTDAERAHGLAFQASLLSGQRRKQLIREAIEMWPDCVEAYMLLGADAQTPKAAQKRYQQAADAAERLIGSERLNEHKGRLSSLPKAEIYLDARAALAESYWDDGNGLAAISHMEAILRLDPRDSRGVHCTLAAWLIAMDDVRGLDAIMHRFQTDDSAAGLYTRAVFHFLKHGSTTESEGLLRTAMRANRWVIIFMFRPSYSEEEDLPESDSSDEDQADALMIASTLAGEWVKGRNVAEWMLGVLAWTLIRPLDEREPISIQGRRRQRKGRKR